MEDTTRNAAGPMNSNEVERKDNEGSTSVEQTEALQMQRISCQIQIPKIKCIMTHHIIIGLFLLLLFRFLLLWCFHGCSTANSSSRYPTHSGRCGTSSSNV